MPAPRSRGASSSTEGPARRRSSTLHARPFWGGPWLVWSARRPRAPGLLGGLRLETRDSLSRVSGRGLGRGTAKALSEWAAARGGRAARSPARSSSSHRSPSRSRRSRGALLATASRANDGAHAGARRPPVPAASRVIRGWFGWRGAFGTSTAESAPPLRRAGEGSALAHPVARRPPSRDERLPRPRERVPRSGRGSRARSSCRPELADQ